MKLRLILLLLVPTLLPLPASKAHFSNKPSVLVIQHATLIDGVSPRPIHDATVTVIEGKIASVATGSVEIPAGATVIDLKGRWLLPGLIDAHAHIRELSSARIALASGVTTLRCLGVERFTDVGIRELNHEGVADLPDVVAAGYAITTKPNEMFFLDFPKLNDLMPSVKGTDAVRRMVRAMAGRGVNVIKIMATERSGLPQTDPLKRMFTDEELAAAADEAKKAGLAVAADAHGDEGAAAAVRAGVRSIEHGTYLSDRTLTEMKERGTYLVPTLSFTTGYAAAGGPESSPVVMARARAMAPRLREMTVRARKLGVKIVAGSDARYDDERRLQDEMVDLVSTGMAPMEAIQAATSVAAECLMISGRVGSVKPGLEADLMAVDSDPLNDVNGLRDVILVINNGRVVLNRFSF